MNDITLIYYTDHTLESEFEKRCQEELIKAAQGKRIISISQKPMTFGDNICLGEIGRSHLSLFKQALAGVKEAKTKYVAMVEHDCMYTPEHFEWIPPDDKVFWYNINHWFVQLETGVYSYQRRKPMSQLICTREMFIPAVEEKILMLETGFEIRKGQPGACEPGVCDKRDAFISAKEKWLNSQIISGEPGVSTNHIKELQIKWDKEHGQISPEMKDVGKESKWRARGFATVLPNLDIRHGNNFSGGRKTSKTELTLPYWGNFKEYYDRNIK